MSSWRHRLAGHGPSGTVLALYTRRHRRRWSAARPLIEAGAAPRGGAQPRQVYVVATSPRCGSSLLRDALASTGRAGAPDEWLASGSGHQRIEDLARSRQSPNGVFGLKAHYHQYRTRIGEEPVLETWLLERARWVWLRRRDRVRQSISYARAMQTGRWSSAEAGAAGEAYDPFLIWLCERSLRRMDRAWRSYFTRRGIGPLELHFEELQQDLEGAVARCLEWIGEDPYPPQPPTTRSQRDGVTEDWVSRYQGSPWHWLGRSRARSGPPSGGRGSG